MSRSQKQNVVGVDHRGIGRLAMLFPNRAAVKFLELTRTRFHVSESTQPDEPIRIIQIAKLADYRHASRFLRLDELSFEKIDQDIALAGDERVLAKLNNGTTRLRAHQVTFGNLCKESHGR